MLANHRRLVFHFIGLPAIEAHFADIETAADAPVWEFDAVGGVEKFFVWRVEFDVEKTQDLGRESLDVIYRILIKFIPGRSPDLPHKLREPGTLDNVSRRRPGNGLVFEEILILHK